MNHTDGHDPDGHDPQVDVDVRDGATLLAAATGTADPDAVDAALDEAIEDAPRGDTEVREPVPGSGELPLLLSGRERFASMGAPPVTGDARVDAASARLQEIPDLPSAEHVDVYEDVHRRLQDALSDADPR